MSDQGGTGRGASGASEPGASKPGTSKPGTGEPGLVVTRNELDTRYEGRVGDELVAVVDYRLSGGVLLVTHTETRPPWRGQGMAGRLTRGLLDDVRARGERVHPVCPFTVSYLRQHPEDRDLLA